MRFKFIGGPFDGDEDPTGSSKVIDDRWISMICTRVPSKLSKEQIITKLDKGELSVALYYLDFECSTSDIVCWKHWKIVKGNPTPKDVGEMLDLSDTTRPT